MYISVGSISRPIFTIPFSLDTSQWYFVSSSLHFLQTHRLKSLTVATRMDKTRGGGYKVMRTNYSMQCHYSDLSLSLSLCIYIYVYIYIYIYVYIYIYIYSKLSNIVSQSGLVLSLICVACTVFVSAFVCRVIHADCTVEHTYHSCPLPVCLIPFLQPIIQLLHILL